MLTQSGPSVASYSAASTPLSGFATLIPDVPWEPPAVAVIVAVPSPTPRTSPELSTRATAASFVTQLKAAFAISCPFASLASAESRTVSPSAFTVSAGGDTVT